MNDLLDLQNVINELYFKSFKGYKGELSLSVPLIPRINKRYLENRVVIIGQETNTWYREGEDDLKNIFLSDAKKIENVCLNDRYDKFVSENVEKYGGSFWNFCRSLYNEKIFKGKIVENENLGHCWLNLFSVEACRNKSDKNGRPTSNKKLAEIIIKLQGELLNNLLKVLKPKLMIFLTGPSLDWAISRQLKNAKFCSVDENEILSTSHLAEITFDDISFLSTTKAFRSYHPTYFSGYINGNKNLKNVISKNNLKVSNSNYYIQTLNNLLNLNKEHWL